ncbi:hypothetical protein ACQBJO_12115 [Janibacter sp. G349]|uniref:hypothetical protein n=1 Tax=Janibacter sp. G349 TaxID=3405424 RepID=UPI003B7D8DFF
MKHIRGTVSVVAAAALLTACSSGPDEREASSTVTVTYSSSTSNAPTTQTVTSSPSPGGGRGTSPDAASTSGTPGGPSVTSTGGPDAQPGGPDAQPGGPTSTDAPSSPPKDIGAYADTFVRAWGRGDRAVASTYGTPTAVSSLFGQRSSGGGGWQRRGMSGDGGSMVVTYGDGSDVLTVRIDAGTAASGGEHAVTSASLDVTDGGENGDDTSGAGLPTSTTAYADAFVRAWGKGDSSAWTYATDGVESGFGAAHPSGGPRWSRTSSTATSATYTDREGGTLVLTLDPSRVSFGAEDGITGASLT